MYLRKTRARTKQKEAAVKLMLKLKIRVSIASLFNFIILLFINKQFTHLLIASLLDSIVDDEIACENDENDENRSSQTNDENTGEFTFILILTYLF